MPVRGVSGRTLHRCGECGAESVKWAGRCPKCGAWGSLVEEATASASRARVPGYGGAGLVTAPARPIADIDPLSARHEPTGMAELDRVLGGGLVPAAVILLAGEPGVGKSTLLLDVAGRWAATGHRALIVTGEESPAQVRARAGRTGALQPSLWLAAENRLEAVLAHVEQVDPSLLVVDSVQTVTSGGLDGAAGGSAQVREVTAALTRVAKERNLTTILVGHVTKDGAVAGPRTLEHLVDVVLQFEGERHSSLRMVRAVKNRFGPADEVGCFMLTEEGISGVSDPSGLFVSQSAQGVPAAGTCTTVTMEGRRAMVAEIQALVATTGGQVPRRAVSGLDSARVALVLAVVERRGRVRLGAADVYTATVGGMRITEPGADLAVALAVAGAAFDTPLREGTVAIGEVGLTGELRPVPGLARRLAAAARIGFRLAVVPGDSGDLPALDGMQIIPVRHLTEAMRVTRAEQA